MTPEVKKRIDQIRHGIVPEDYRKTKAGIVPTDWSEHTIADCLERVERPVEVKADGMYTQIGIRSHGKGIFYKEPVTGESLGNKAVFWIEPDCFVLNIVFAWEQAIGKTTQKEVGMIGSHRFPMYRPIDKRVDIDYLISYLMTKRGKDILEAASPGGAGRNRTLGQDRFMNSKIVLPTPAEQKKIAEILSTQDKVIELERQRIDEILKVKQFFLGKMFPKKGQAVPEIRFKGFTGVWEQRKLGDIADIVGGGTPSTGNQSYWDGDIDWYAPAEIADQIYANSSQKKITGLGYENSSAKMLPPGTVLFTSRAGIGKTAILTRKGCTNQGFQSIVPHRGELDSYFIFSRTEELKRYGELVGAGSTFVEVSGKQMAVMELMMPPTMREQQTIGGFFQQLDHLITLHQRKCIFFTGREGRLISTVNKKRITSSWEQRKLASLCEKFTDGDWIESKDQSDFGVRLVQTGNVGVAEYLDKPNNKKWISEDTFDRLHCEEVLPGDILISRLPEPAGRACIVPLLGTKMITAVDCTIVRTAPDMSNKFLVQYLSSQAYFDDVNTCLAGGTRQRISRGNLANFNVPIPVKKSEQDAIGMFFGYLDNLITLHQRKPFLMKWRTSDANRNQTNRLVL